MKYKVKLEKYINFSLISNCIIFNTLAGCCKNKNKNEKKESCYKKKPNIENNISNNDNPDPNKKPDDDGNDDPKETEEEKAKKLLEKQKQDNLKKQLNDYKTKIQSVLDEILPLLDNLEKKYNIDNSKTDEDLQKVNVLDYNTTEIKTKLDDVTKEFKNDALYKNINTGFKTKLDSLNTRYNTLVTNINALDKKVNEIKIKLAKNKNINELISEIDKLLKDIEGLLENDKDNSLIGIKIADTKLIEKKIEITKYIGIFNDIRLKLTVLEEKVNNSEGDEKTTYKAKVKDLKTKIVESENNISDFLKNKFNELKNNNSKKEIEEFINTNFTEANLKPDKIEETSKNIEKFKNKHDLSNLSNFKTEIKNIAKFTLYNKKISKVITDEDIKNLYNDFRNENKKIDIIKDFCDGIYNLYKNKDNVDSANIIYHLKIFDNEIGDDTNKEIINILKKVINSIIDDKLINKLNSKKLDELEDFSKCTDDDSIINYFNVIEEAKYTLKNNNITDTEDYKKLKHLKYDLYNDKIQEFENKFKKKSEDENYKAKKSEFDKFFRNCYDGAYNTYSEEITYPDFIKDDSYFNKLKEKLDNIKIEDAEKSFDDIKELVEHFNNYNNSLNNTKKAIESKIELCKKLLEMLNKAENNIYFKYKNIKTADKIKEINDEKSELETDIKSSFKPKIEEYDAFSKKNDKFTKFYKYYDRVLYFEITLSENSFDDKNEKICQLTLKTQDFDGKEIIYNSTDTGTVELKHEKYDYKDSLGAEIKNCSKFKISDNLYKEIKRKSCTNNLNVTSNINNLVPEKNPLFYYNYYLIMEIKDGDHYIYFVPVRDGSRGDLCNSLNFIDVFGSNIILSSYMPSSFGIDEIDKQQAVIKIHSLNTNNLSKLSSNIKFFDLRRLYFQEVSSSFQFPKNSTIVFDFNNIGNKVNFEKNSIYVFSKDDKVTVYIVKRDKFDKTATDEMYQKLLKKFPEDNRINIEFIDEDDPRIKI